MDFGDPLLYKAIFAVAASAVLPHAIARSELSTKFFSQRLGSTEDAHRIFIVFTVLIGLWRDACFVEAISSQPKSVWLNSSAMFTSALVLLIVGGVFVYVGLYRLGMRGAFYGDHFGFSLPRRVTSFPFDTLDHPMYVGSSMMSAGTAILNTSWAGLALAVLTWGLHRLIISAEAKHTNQTYGPYVPPVNSNVFRILAMNAVTTSIDSPRTPTTPRK